MDEHCILQAPGVAACQGYRHRDPTGAGLTEHQAVALRQTFQAEAKPAKLILAIRIGACNVEQQIRVGSSLGLASGRVQALLGTRRRPCRPPG